MNFSLYDISIPAFIRSLNALLGILDKAKLHADTNKIDMSVLFQTRLIPTQFPLSKQIQIACDAAKLFVPRLTDLKAPSFEDKESTFDEFKTRIQETIAFLETVTPEDFKLANTKIISFPWKPGYELAAKDYILQHSLPNFYFHITTAYSILRSIGVDLGKSDYLGKISWK